MHTESDGVCKSTWKGQNMRRTLTVFTIAMFALTFSSTVTLGAVIDFSTLPGNTDDPFTTYTQNNFTVSSTTGSWFKAFVYGNPVPDIYLGPIGAVTPGSITVT